MSGRRAAALGAPGLVLAFAVLAILNTGGYRYGASDQAFYVPAVLLRADPDLFPRDRDLLAAEARFMVFDDLLGAALRRLPVNPPVLLFVLHLGTLAALALALWALGRTMYASRWTAAALVLAMTLRHRIAKTGVNTLETNFHPRILAFALGIAALVASLRGRWIVAFPVVAAAAAVHPTTGLWFGVAVAVTAYVAEPRLRPPLLGALAIAALFAVWAVTNGPLQERIVVMSPEWLATLAMKDYLFPTGWSAGTWLLNLVYPVVLGLLFVARRRAGVGSRAESGLVVAMAVLFGIFLISLPLTHARIALAVQLQVSRTLWLLDLTATAFLLWFLMEAPWRGRAAPTRRSVVLAVAALSLIRGAYITFVERSGDPFLTIDLPDDDWGRTMRWLEATPADTFVLADPGHLWRYGSSVRMAARRDVYLEEVKDTALAMYSPVVAARVLLRIQRTAEFQGLTAARARELAHLEDLDYLVTEAQLDLPLAFRSGRFKVYDLKKGSGGFSEPAIRR